MVYNAKQIGYWPFQTISYPFSNFGYIPSITLKPQEGW